MEWRPSSIEGGKALTAANGSVMLLRRALYARCCSKRAVAFSAILACWDAHRCREACDMTDAGVNWSNDLCHNASTAAEDLLPRVQGRVCSSLWQEGFDA